MAEKSTKQDVSNMPLKQDTRWKLALFLSTLKADLNALTNMRVVVRVFGRNSDSGIPYIAIVVASLDQSVTTTGTDFMIDGVSVDEIVAR